jgi:hypothetical protein
MTDVDRQERSQSNREPVSYEPPVLTSLGTVAEVTASATTKSGDDTNFYVAQS